MGRNKNKKKNKMQGFEKNRGITYGKGVNSYYGNYYRQPAQVVPEIIVNDKYYKSVNTDLLQELFNLQTPSHDDVAQNKFLRKLALEILKDSPQAMFTVDNYGNLYVEKREKNKPKNFNYPCFVSHVDTVHSHSDTFSTVISPNGKFILGLDTSEGTQHGIGADPKNGVYIILELLKHNKNMKAVFFKDEEVGCIGSGACDITFFHDCAFVGQPDRRSFTCDLIEKTNGIQVLSETFKYQLEAAMEEFGYSFNTGTCTDVGELAKKGLGINCFNMSNGSFREHQSSEVCGLPHLLNALNMAQEIINLGLERELYNYRDFIKYTPPAQYYGSGAWGWEDEFPATSSYVEKEVKQKKSVDYGIDWDKRKLQIRNNICPNCQEVDSLTDYTTYQKQCTICQGLFAKNPIL